MTNDSNSSDKVISGHDVNRFAEDAFRKGGEAISNADLDKQEKVFGLFEMDAGLASGLTSVYNVLTDNLSKIIGEHSFRIVNKLGPQIGLKEGSSTLQRTAALSTLGIDIALKSGAYIGPIFDGFSKQRKEQAKLAQTLAPVLDDLKGNHTAAALLSVKLSDNELIYAHRRRLAKIADAANLNNFIELAVSAGPNIAFNFKEFGNRWQGKPSRAARTEDYSSGSNDDGKMNLQDMGRNAWNGVSGPVAQRLKKSNDHKLEKSLTPYSALEMILTLDEQVGAKPDASSYQAPGKDGDAYPLEEYLMRILIQHQKDMSMLNPNYTELREALKDDMAAVAKPLAAAIRTGDMSPLALIRLVGEGKIIKNHGRSIASTAEVVSLIKHDAPKQSTYVHADPREYYKQASFSHDDLKLALSSLEGEEKRIFASMIPDSVLEDAGMKPDEIKDMRAATAKNYEHMLGEALVGLHAQTPVALKQAGLAHKEIEQLEQAVEEIKRDGVKAVHKLKTTSANANGVERDIVNWAVPQIKGDKSHFGKVLADGHAQFSAVAGAVTKPKTKENLEVANEDNDLSHVERAAARQSEQAENARE